MKIYSWKELAQRRYSTPEKLQAAREAALLQLKKMHTLGWIISGCVFGSTARGDQGYGSDLDTFVISKPTHYAEVADLLQRLHRVSEGRYSIPLQVIHITKSEAETGAHTVSPFLFGHMMRNFSSSGIGANPARVMQFRGSPAGFVREELRYLVNRARKNRTRLTQERSTQTATYYKLLGQCMDAVNSGGRRLLDVFGETNKMKVDSKAHVIERIALLLGKKSSAAESFKQIVELTNAYKRALKNSIAAVESGEHTRMQRAKKEYETTISALEAVVPASDNFLTTVGKAVHLPQRQMRTKKRARFNGTQRPRRKKIH